MPVETLHGFENALVTALYFVSALVPVDFSFKITAGTVLHSHLQAFLRLFGGLAHSLGPSSVRTCSTPC